MSTEENKALFLRYQAALRAKNTDDLKAVLAPEFVGHDLPPTLPSGPAGLILFRMKQTHLAEYMGIAASGKPITIELIEIDRIENGRKRWLSGRSSGVARFNKSAMGRRTTFASGQH